MKHLFKLFTFAILFSGLMIFGRCSEDETTFAITLDDVDACMPAGIKDTTVWITVSKDDIETLFSQNGVNFNLDDVQEVKLNTATIGLVSPSGENFDEIVAFDMWFREVGASDNGTKVAYLSDSGIADNVATVTLESQFSELVGFVALDQFEVGMHINRNPPASVAKCLQGTISLNVTVTGD